MEERIIKCLRKRIKKPNFKEWSKEWIMQIISWQKPKYCEEINMLSEALFMKWFSEVFVKAKLYERHGAAKTMKMLESVSDKLKVTEDICNETLECIDDLFKD